MADATATSFSIGSNLWPGTAKLIEEMGELAQVLGKLIALGGQTDHWDGTNLRDRLIDEIGDVTAALRFLIRINALDEDAIEKRASQKIILFLRWQIEHAPATDGGTDG